jgi:hypothetical protein
MQMLRFEVLLHVLPLCKALSVGFASRPQLWRPPVLLTASVGAPAADTLLRQLFADAGEATTVDASAVAAACAADVEWVDMGLPQPLRGRDAVQAHLASLHPAGSKLFIERLSDGARSGGMCWHREAEGVEGQQGLRGITYVELDEHGAISFVQEGYEPLFKLGKLLETIFKLVKPKGQAVDAKGYEQATPTDAEGIVRYLWYVAYPGGAEPAEALRFFAADCVYEDLNYQEPFVGEAQISEYFDLLPEIPNVVFVPGRISEGRRGCTFTWSVTVNGQDGPAGISFKEVDGDGKVAFNRDIPAPAWPRPVGRLAARLRPRLRTFRGRRSAAPRMGAGSAGDGAEALSVVETLKTRPTRSAMAATWVLFSLYVALASPGSFDLSPDSLDNQLIANSIADPSSLNPIFFFVFNALGLIRARPAATRRSVPRRELGLRLRCDRAVPRTSAAAAGRRARRPRLHRAVRHRGSSLRRCGARPQPRAHRHQSRAVRRRRCRRRVWRSLRHLEARARLHSGLCDPVLLRLRAHPRRHGAARLVGR